MDDEISSNFIKDYFLNNFTIECRKIEENKGQNGKTPDFLLYKNYLNFAVCEVKDIRDDINDGTWEKRNDNGIKSYEKESGFSVGKIVSKIKDAYEQLKSYNLPKIVVFVNYWSDHALSLNGVLKKPNEIKNKIDLYIWLDKGSVNKEDKIHFRFYDNNSTGKLLRQYFLKPKKN